MHLKADRKPPLSTTPKKTENKMKLKNGQKGIKIKNRWSGNNRLG